MGKLEYLQQRHEDLDTEVDGIQRVPSRTVSQEGRLKVLKKERLLARDQIERLTRRSVQ
jgi:hypothetical protein